MKKIFFIILLLVFCFNKNSFANENSYVLSSCDLDAFGLMQVDLNLKTKRAVLVRENRAPMVYKIQKIRGDNAILNYLNYRINFKRGEVSFQIGKNNHVILCDKINGRLSYHGKIREEKNKVKTVAKKPKVTANIPKSFDLIFCREISTDALIQDPIVKKVIPVFKKKGCQSLKTRSHRYSEVDYELFKGVNKRVYGRKMNICLSQTNKLEVKRKCTSGRYVTKDINGKWKIGDAQTTIVKKPVQKKPEKNIIRSTEVDGSLITIGSGSGFYINNKGYALTNNHVIDICKQSIAVIDGKETLFRVIATDKTNDVAVLKTDLRSKNYIKINEDGAKLGESVIAVGYPLAGRLSDSVKITRGIVSSTSGLNNNIGQIQIDAALQPGNSGGPVLNENGELVGIASAGLNKLLMAKEAKYIPENVNFAVASPIVVNILKSKKIKYSTPSMFSGSYSNTELAELGNSSTIQLFCRNTRTAYNRLKSSNKYSTVLLDLD